MRAHLVHVRVAALRKQALHSDLPSADLHHWHVAHGVAIDRAIPLSRFSLSLQKISLLERGGRRSPFPRYYRKPRSQGRNAQVLLRKIQTQKAPPTAAEQLLLVMISTPLGPPLLSCCLRCPLFSPRPNKWPGSIRFWFNPGVL